MRWVLGLFAVCALGQSYRVEPATVKQGGTIRVTGGASGASARLLNRTIRLFAQEGGERFGLMPVRADEVPGAYPIQVLAQDGSVLHSATVTILDAHFPEQNIKLDPKVQALQPAPGEMETVAAFRNTVSEARHWREPFAPPIPGCMVSPYGVKRLHNGKSTGNYHGGLDQRGPEGEPIRAIADGTVRLVREYNVHGNVVGVDHGQGVASIYLHMSKFAVPEGAAVKKGDAIGYVGSTGRSTAPHLHWGLYVNGVAVNPAEWVAVKACGAPGKRVKKRGPAPK